ncbi:hypothetical protein FRC01_014827 [Tulasnella sp. 417]|nr:hypothetical protein FRC01_014827 [Tulasnella sp. 417]
MARPTLSCSLLLACLLVLLVSPNPSAALTHVRGPNAAPRHLQHAQVADLSKKRMVKVRQFPFGNDDGKDTGNDTGNNGPSGSVSSTTTTSAAATTTAAVSTTTTTTTTTSAAPTTTSALPSTTSTTTTTTTTTTTPPAVVTPTLSASLNLIPQASSSSPTSAAASRTVSVATAEVTVDLPTQSADAESSNTSASTFGRNTIIAIVVIASCVGGAAAIWTLIRKWKLGPSAKFEERMAPIEWAPEMGTTAGAGIPGAERDKAYGATEKHSRSGSHGSFHSSDVDHNAVGRNVTGNTNMFADQHPASYAPDAHDFTAGPAHHATGGYDAYGNPAAGYVDLQRTNSNGSNRSDQAGLQRGPSVGHATAAAPYAYDNGYGNAAYGHDAYGQDAYAGYDAYGQHYPAQQGQYGAQQGQYGAQQGQYGARY